MRPLDFDVLICGGGMVGASLARALAPAGLRVAIIEAVEPESAEQPSYDDRAIALSWGSRCILARLGAWDALQHEAGVIDRVHISEQGRFGAAWLTSAQAQVPALGYVVAARALGRALSAGIGEHVEVFCPYRMADLSQADKGVEVVIEGIGASHRLRARLLVAADGARSWVRERLAIPVAESAYGQSAIIANLTPGLPHRGVAYERFTRSGPMAFLPMPGERCALVWTVPEGSAPELLALDDAGFLAAAQDRFGYRLGRLRRLGARSCYPLRRLFVSEQVHQRVVLIGNAAHTLHPVAGQGFNLGLRDVVGLARILESAAIRRGDPGDAEALARYRAARDFDQRSMLRITDSLVRLFLAGGPFLSRARGLGLIGLDLCEPLKRAVSQRFMGLGMPLPRVERGVSRG